MSIPAISFYNHPMPKFSSCPQGVVTHKRVIPNNGDVAWKTEFVLSFGFFG